MSSPLKTFSFGQIFINTRTNVSEDEMTEMMEPLNEYLVDLSLSIPRRELSEITPETIR